MSKPHLNEGELYVGRINDEHIILLPGDNDDATWVKQMGWAKSIGGDLPTKIEQEMLLADFRDEFKNDWYWSRDVNPVGSGYPRIQLFCLGLYNDVSKYDSHRARAVRRVNIGEIDE